ncbi:protein kinase [Streptomyces sp. NPDC049936]|uniref:protein kinase domain-containing protein n=1 Tax=Streptomyces sp. NPDC049936 TaxID=3365599 RepID=UPI0037904AD5
MTDAWPEQVSEEEFRTVQPLTPADPVRIGRYRLTGRLGSGGMGSVYLGSTPGGRPAAIKVISDRFQYEERALERFRREVATLRTVRSAYTASLIDSGLDGPPYWFATEYVPGRTLDSAVRSSGPLSPHLCRSLLAALAEGLSDIHVHGILHRDVKPQNIILSPVGPQLIDFGIAKGAEQPGLTQAGLTPGTPGFTSPEALLGAEVGVAADVFALGATLAFAATGRSPFGDGNSSTVAYRTVQGDIDVEGVDPDLVKIIRACTDRDPARRPIPETVVEFCQSRTSLAEDSQYRRIAAAEEPDSSMAAVPVPTVVDRSPGPVSRREALTAAATAPVAPALRKGGLRRRLLALAGAGLAACLLAAVWVLSDRNGGEHPIGETGASPASRGAQRPDASQNAEEGAAPRGEGGSVPRERTVRAPMSLQPGQEVAAARIKLVLQYDGNLVAYDEAGHDRWSSRTRGDGARADFQIDGNLVVYDGRGKAIWSSRTSGHEGALLSLQSDGNITIRKGASVLWTAGTNH